MRSELVDVRERVVEGWQIDGRWTVADGFHLNLNRQHPLIHNQLVVSCYREFQIYMWLKFLRLHRRCLLGVSQWAG